MGIQFRIRKFKRRIKRLFTKKNLLFGGFVLVLGGVVCWSIVNQKYTIDPTAYDPLLEVIASGESHGNYNAYFGNVANTSQPNFTTMSISEVIIWQQQYIQQGSPSNAVGRYQIIEPTLRGLVTSLKIDTSDQFDEPMQDKLAIALIERRGSLNFIAEKMTDQDFAHQLSKEWAALPQVIGQTPEQSYYAGDGLNISQVPSTAILKAVQEFKKLAQ